MPATDCRPELDTSHLLGLDDHHKYQMLLGMLHWMVTAGKPELCQLVSSMSRVGAYPRQDNSDLAVRSFGYVKTTLNNQITINSRSMLFQRPNSKFKNLISDFLKDYPEDKEKLDPGLCKAFGPILQSTIFVDLDYAHNLATRRSLTGLITYVGSTPIILFSKRHGSIISSVSLLNNITINVDKRDSSL